MNKQKFLAEIKILRITIQLIKKLRSFSFKKNKLLHSLFLWKKILYKKTLCRNKIYKIVISSKTKKKFLLNTQSLKAKEVFSFTKNKKIPQFKKDLNKVMYHSNKPIIFLNKKSILMRFPLLIL
jgi:hypothetical protein